jgi:hypothetical protein
MNGLKNWSSRPHHSRISEELEMKSFALLLLLFVAAPIAYGQSRQTMTVRLYFPNTRRSKVECAARVFPATRRIPKTASVAKATLEQLFAGPTRQEKARGFISDFSEATKSLLISVNVKNKAAYVNLRNLLATAPALGNFTTSCGGTNFFGQVENTLKQFPSIKKVFFAVEGDPAFFYDWMQIGECPEELKNCDASNFIKSSHAQQTGNTTQALITSFRLDKPNNEFFGTLYATINGAEIKVAEVAIDAWIIEQGRNLVYSMRDGAGGFENEGESLRVYNARTGKTRKIMSEYYAVHDLTEVKTTRGRTALLVAMTDGGLGAFYLAVVDPSRGEVFFRKWARLLSRKGDIITIGYYRQDDDWTAFYDNQQNPKVRPYKTEKYNLTAILKRRVITNKPNRPS